MSETQKENAKTLSWNFHPSKDYGSDWVGYFAEYREQLNAVKNKVVVDKSPVVKIWGHQASGDEPIAPQNMEWADLLHNHGWEYKIGYSQYFKPAASKVSHDKLLDRSYIQAVKRGRMLTIAYENEVGTNGWKMDNFVVWGKPTLRLVKELKEEITS